MKYNMKYNSEIQYTSNKKSKGGFGNLMPVFAV